MKLEGKQKLLRIFVGEQDKYAGRPLYEVIVEEARHRGMAGATVLKGFMGFGAKAHIHTAKLLDLSEDLPVVIEVVDTEEKVKGLLPELGKLIKDGLVTLETVEVVIYRADAATPRAKKGQEPG